ncbi:MULTISPECIES: hypothetical protein [unclassified Paenibacillus]|uniref:hypothetical protein n=1 Tax=unclassified Paenibacillus TaxID=185978 RepID=UPI0014793D75|nr:MULTISPECIES: hypothetical protein [unclassified Paenibacillus]
MKTRTQRTLLAIPFVLAVITIATRLDFYYDSNMTIRFIAAFLVAFPAGYWAAGGAKED